jgi:hypothetical protein
MIPHWHVDAYTIDPSHDAQVRVELAKVAFFWKAFLSIEKPIGQNP